MFRNRGAVSFCTLYLFNTSLLRLHPIRNHEHNCLRGLAPLHGWIGDWFILQESFYGTAILMTYNGFINNFDYFKYIWSVCATFGSKIMFSMSALSAFLDAFVLNDLALLFAPSRFRSTIIDVATVRCRMLTRTLSKYVEYKQLIVTLTLLIPGCTMRHLDEEVGSALPESHLLLETD